MRVEQFLAVFRSSQLLSFQTMSASASSSSAISASPWVLQIITHRIRDSVAERDVRWTLLGTLQDLNWDRPTPLKLGPQPQPYVFLVDALTLGIKPSDCAAYMKAENSWSDLIREESFNYSGCTVYASLRADEEEIMGYFGDKIDAAVSEFFDPDEPETPPPASPSLAPAPTAPPWAGLYPKTASDATDEDLYV
jgi:hypothetical protein